MTRCSAFTASHWSTQRSSVHPTKTLRRLNQRESSILSVSMTHLMSENAAKSAYFGTAPSLLAASQGVIIPKWFAHNGTNTIWPRTSKELWHRDCLLVVVRRILAPPKFSHQTSLKCIKSVKHHSSRLLKWAWRLHRNRTQRSPGGDAFWGVGLHEEPLQTPPTAAQRRAACLGTAREMTVHEFVGEISPL